MSGRTLFFIVPLRKERNGVVGEKKKEKSKESSNKEKPVQSFWKIEFCLHIANFPAVIINSSFRDHF